MARKIKRIKKWIRHPLKTYTEGIKNSVIPKPYSHQIRMNILIKKGQQSGTALIPCTIYAMDHSIDLNPALIKRKTREVAKCYGAKTKFIADKEADGITQTKKIVRYNPNDYVLELTEDEKNKGYELKELERCHKCGQKLVMAEIKQTRYRSCPSIHIRLGDPAKEDTVVPVEFGINKKDITKTYWFIPVATLIFGWFTAMTLGFVNEHTLTDLIKKIPFVNIGPQITIPHLDWWVNGIILFFIWIVVMPRALYKSYRLLKWYNSVKHTLRKSVYKTT